VFGDAREADQSGDGEQAAEIYSLLETAIVPEFYERERDIPVRWVARIRESMARLTTTFSANRSVRQYTEELYLPLASAYAARARNHGALAAEIVAWERDLAIHWRNVRFGPLHITTHNGHYCFRVEVRLGRIRPADVAVELYAAALDDGPPFRAAMSLSGAVEGGLVYAAAAPTSRPADHYTPRVIPRHEAAFIPAENRLIAWQK
jgi:starch phosphorylase